MKTIKIVIISATAIGFVFWLWSNPIREQTKREFDAANSQEFALQHSGSVSGSATQNQIVKSAVQSSNSTPFYILLTPDHLSLEAVSQPLRTIVDKITRQSGIAIVMSEAIVNSPTTVRFNDLSIEQGLQLLFENYDIFFFYTRNNDKLAHLASVWVYPQGQGKKFAPNSSSIAASANESITVRDNETKQNTTDPDPVKRASAIANLVEQQGSGATEIVQNALTDPDERIRIHTLDAALRARIDLPLETLIDLSQNDASGKIRSIALAGMFNRFAADGLAGSSDILEVLAAAQKDDDPEVSELAAQLMKSLEETSTKPSEQESQESLDSQEESMDP